MNLNDRLEYETLWRYPIRENLMSAVGKRNELATSGRFKLFSDFEKIHNDMNQKRSEFQSVRIDFIHFCDLIYRLLLIANNMSLLQKSQKWFVWQETRQNIDFRIWRR